MRTVSSRAVAFGARQAQRRTFHALQHTAVRSPPAAALTSALHLPRSAAPAWSSRSAFSYPTSRTLDEIVKLPLLIPHTRDEVVAIWTAQHDYKNSNQGLALADSISKAEFDTFVERAKRAPLFIVPAFRVSAASASTPYDSFDVTSGFENMLVNVQASSLLLTSLEEYKLRGAGAASPFAVVTLYADLASSHDLVLVRAELMDVSVTQAQLRAMWALLRGLYAATDASSAPAQAFEQFAAPFNKKPSPTFDFDAYVAYCKEQVGKMQLLRQASVPPEAEIVASASAPAAGQHQQHDETAAPFTHEQK